MIKSSVGHFKYEIKNANFEFWDRLKKKRMLIDERLYLPKKWIDDKARCLKAKIPPEEIKFRTKQELGLEMIDNAISSSE